MNIILDPMISFLDKINFKKRFFFISLLIFGALTTISWLYISGKVHERYYLMSETAPAKLYEPITEMMRNLQTSMEQHVQTNLKMNDASPSSKAIEADDNIDISLAHLKNSNLTGFKADQINQLISTIEVNWKNLKPALARGYSEDLFNRQQEVTDKLSDLLELIADDSDLGLDTDPLTFNMVDIFMKYAPSTAEKANLLRNLGTTVLLQKQATPPMREHLNYVLALYEDYNSNLLASLQRLIDLDSVYAKSFGTQLEVVQKNAIGNIVKRDILQATTLDRPASEYANELNRLVQDYNNLADMTYKAFNERVDVRIKALDYQITSTVIGLSVVFLFICLIFVAFFRSTDRAVQILITHANAIADGDLSRDLSETRSDEFGVLMKTLANMRNKISEIIQQIKNTSNVVGRGASEISQGNLDLSKRTEQQASSLASTAASMEELSITVKENAKQSQKAAELAEHARKQADTSGTVVNEAVSAMTQINASSNKIAEISGVIDEIAFQTNLLALNAAIEAARAGEQGRGFAVVAQEVRNLAQRSSTAAKEINTLINDSVEKINKGAELVTKSGDALHEIVKSAGSVSDLVGSIATATTQQSKGLEEINKAITQMDGITQQNAALVEETAAASENVNQQVRNLIKQIEFFKDPNLTENLVAHQANIITHTMPIVPGGTKTEGKQPPIDIQTYMQPPSRRGKSDQDWSEF